jgi:hypothetical protein
LGGKSWGRRESEFSELELYDILILLLLLDLRLD